MSVADSDNKARDQPAATPGQGGDTTVEERTVVVEGLGKDLTEELLRLYFEHPRNGGGEIDSVHLDGAGGATIVYKESEVAKNIIDKKTHSYAGCELQVSAPAAEPVGGPSAVDVLKDVTSALLVEGLKPIITKDVLEMFFENTKRSGGGEIRDIQILPGGKALIWFIEKEVVDRINGKAANGTLSFAGCELTVKAIADERRVWVTGVCDKTPEFALDLLFTNPGKSGGGDVDEINVGKNSAVITFKDADVARRVVEQRSFTLNDCSLKAELYLGQSENQAECVYDQASGAIADKVSPAQKPIEPEEKEEDDDTVDDSDPCESCTIQVTGTGPDTAQDTVKMFFGNRGRSGGGQVDNIWREPESGDYLITFSDRTSVERVLQRRPLSLEGFKLSIKELESACRDRGHSKGTVELDKVYITGLNERITRDQLALTLESYTGGEVTDVFYPIDPHIGMVTCKEKIDFRKLQNMLARKPIEGCSSMLGMERVPFSNQIQVFNIGTISEGSLATYFENTKRSGGSGDVSVEINHQEGWAVVTFESHQIMANVLKKQDQNHENRPLNIRVHRERLGIIPPGHDHSQPGIQIPTDQVFSSLDPNVLQYWGTVPGAVVDLEKKLGQSHGKLELNGTNGAVTVKCTIAKDDRTARTQVRTWAASVKAIVETEAASVSVKRRPCLGKIWDLVSTEVKKIGRANKGVALIERREEYAVYVVGRADMVDSVYAQVEKLCADFEQTSEHIKTTMELKGTDRGVFNKANELDKIRQQHPKLKIQVRREEIELEGPPTDLLTVQGKIHSFLKMIQTRSVELSKFKLRVLQGLLAQDNSYLHKSTQQLKAMMQVENNEAVIYGIGQDSIRYENVLEDVLREATIKVTEDEKAALNGTIWRNLTTDLSKKCNGILFIELTDNNSGIHLAAHRCDIDKVMEDIQQHIKKNTIKKESVNMDPLHVKYIKRHMKEQLKEIERNFAAYSLKIQANTTGFQISGTQDGLGPAKTRIQKLKGEIKKDKQAVPFPGMMNYFQNEEMGRLFLKNQEDTHKVLIHHGEVDQAPAAHQVHEAAPEWQGLAKRPAVEVKPGPGAMPMTYPQPGQITHSSGVKIKAALGDMTTLSVDVIVNAANSKLKHIGGLAKAIVDKGGVIIQEECNQYVKINGEVPEGRAMLTAAGKLPSSYIIHAVGPHWMGGRAGEKDKLYDCVFSHILDIVDNENMTSVAIPAISAGVFGFPAAESTSIIVEAIKDFLDGNNGVKMTGSISEILLVDNKQHTIDAFNTALNKFFKRTPPPIAAKPKAALSTPDSSKLKMIDSKTLQTAEGMRITTKKGGIADERAELLLNTTLMSLNLNSGGVSKSIYQAAGSSIQDELLQKHPKGLKEGEYAVSSGGMLGASAIIHAVLCSWSRGDDVARSILKNIILEFLGYATKTRYVSVALPALGTGGLNFPRDVVAETMFNSVLEFSQKNPNSTVKDVRFVLFPGDQQTIDIFENHMSKLLGTSTAWPKSGSTSTPSEEEGAAGGEPRPFARVEPLIVGSQAQNADNSGGEIQIGSILLQVVPGDITREKTDAIINSTDQRIDLRNGAVCKALAAAGGQSLVDECKNKGTVGPNGVAVTGAGTMFVNNIIHLNVRGMQKTNDWKEGILKCLQEAEKLRLTSLSFPALGTGNLNVPSNIMAVTMMETIAEFSRKNVKSPINLIRVVVFQDDMIAKYIEEMKRVASSGSSILGVMISPFKFVGKKVKDWTFGKSKPIPEKKPTVIAEQRTTFSNVADTGSALELIILGTKSDSISAVKEEIRKFCQRETASSVIFELEYVEIIKALTSNQVTSLQQLGDNTGVRVEINQTKINIRGQKSDVYKAEAKVKETLFKIKSERMEQGSQNWDLPKTWDPMDGVTNKLVTLKAWDTEYKEVMAEFRKTCNNEIIKIERIQNEYLYKTYRTHKDHMKKRVSRGSQYEHHLFHGTSADTVSKIYTNGFDRSFNGKNATMFGQGVYFATESSYSRKYCREDSNGNMQMFYALVLTGEYTKGDSSMRTPPYMSGDSIQHYDSTVNKTDKPTIYVIYKDNQAYPEFIITFKK